ncbi:MAG: type II toxin-antitoxin system HicB family antitoxin [Synergistaceae bacterium]
MSKFIFPALVSNNYENGSLWVVNFPSLHGCWVEGPTKEDVLSRASSVLHEYLSGLIENGLSVPAPTEIILNDCWDMGEVVRIECVI